MILKGNQRGGSKQMAVHLLNGEQNEHVTVHQVKGFMAGNVMDALNEVHALSKGTQCRQFLYSVSLNPPRDESVPIEFFEKAIKKIENKLGLKDQPRVVVFHEKEGRRHAHCVWSRIDLDEMKAINLSFDHRKLQSVSREIFLENNWTMPKGLVNPEHKNPLNFTRAEWQQALRTGQSAKTIKACLQECWAVSDNRKSLESALLERGYFLAKGDRRKFVVVDVHGEVYSFARQIGKPAKELISKIGDMKSLPSVDETKNRINTLLEPLFSNYRTELQQSHGEEMRPLLRIKRTMTSQHRKDRDAQKAYQEKRWGEEEKLRSSRIHKGFKGLWDKLTLKYWKLREQNEKEAWKCFVRDRDERQDLIETQLDQRQKLQGKIETLQTRQDAELQKLTRDLSGMMTESVETDATPEALKGQSKLADLAENNPVSLVKKQVRRRGASEEDVPDTDPEH